MGYIKEKVHETWLLSNVVSDHSLGASCGNRVSRITEVNQKRFSLTLGCVEYLCHLHTNPVFFIYSLWLSEAPIYWRSLLMCTEATSGSSIEQCKPHLQEANTTATGCPSCGEGLLCTFVRRRWAPFKHYHLCGDLWEGCDKILKTPFSFSPPFP